MILIINKMEVPSTCLLYLIILEFVITASQLPIPLNSATSSSLGTSFVTGKATPLQSTPHSSSVGTSPITGIKTPTPPSPPPSTPKTLQTLGSSGLVSSSAPFYHYGLSDMFILTATKTQGPNETHSSMLSTGGTNVAPSFKHSFGHPTVAHASSLSNGGTHVPPSFTLSFVSTESSTQNSISVTTSQMVAPNSTLSTGGPNVATNFTPSTVGPFVAPSSTLSTGGPFVPHNSMLSTVGPYVSPSSTLSAGGPNVPLNSTLSTGGPNAAPNSTISTVTTESSTQNSISVTTSHNHLTHECICVSNTRQTFWFDFHNGNLTVEQKNKILQDELKKLQSELYLEKKSLTSSIRARTSAEDNRPSAQKIGCVGVVTLVLIGIVFPVIDLARMFGFLSKTKTFQSFVQKVY